MHHPEAMVVLPLDRLVRLLYDHFLALPGAEVKWNNKVVGIEHGEKEAKVKVETQEGEQTLAADYVIGADGANSQIRRSLFGELAFPGETLQHQIIATNVGSTEISECVGAGMRETDPSECRYTMISISLGTGTRTSLCTPRTGSWQLALRQTAFGA